MKLELKNLATVFSNLDPSDELYLPNFEKNVFRLRNTFENLLSVADHKNSLLEYKDIEKMISMRGCSHPKNILHFTIDSLGMNQLEAKNHFFDEYRANNDIIELSSVFPTITSAVVCSLHSGLPPEVHGLLGHKIFFPEIGNIINTLNSNVPRSIEYQKDSLVRSGVNPKALLWKYNPPTLKNVEDYIQVNFLREDIAMTGLSHFMLEPNSIISYRNYIDGFEKVRKLLKRDEKIYIHFYIGDIDDISHIYGPFSPEYEKMSNFLDYILSNFIKSLDPVISDQTLITISADHGQNHIPDDKRIIFDKDAIKEIKEYLYAPMGKSGRVLHFYALEKKIDDLKKILEEKIENRGIVLTSRDDLRPLFSTSQNYEKIFDRLGNVIVVLKSHYSAEREYKDQGNQERLIDWNMMGHHGSLTKDELIVPFFIDKVSEFKKFV